jgi:DNA ligase (NAD+)
LAPSGKKDAREQIARLCRELDRHGRLYYLEDRPVISDADYDGLLRQLGELETRFPEFARSDSPTQRVGAPPAAGFESRAHLAPMLSLDNALGEAELQAFDQRVRRELGREDEPIEYACEPKLDGAGIELIYRDGQLEAGLTRGDGSRGEDVTANLRLVLSIPLAIEFESVPPTLSVRGEIVLPKAPFRRLNAARIESGEEPFANPRNAAAGALRQLHQVDRRRLRSLEFRAYAVADPAALGVASQMEILGRLADFGFAVSPESAAKKGIDAVARYHEELLRGRNDLPVECDGSVVKLNRLDQQDEVGNLARSPRWAIAMKFPPEQARTRVEAIEVQVGRTGALTPVAKLTPVSVGGVTVSNASLHNQDEIDRKDVRIGDTIVVQRAGDVIPQIVGVIPEERPAKTRRFRLPKRCPVCKAQTVRLEGEVVTRCPNLDCPAQLKTNLRHLASRGAFDIEGLGEKLIDQLVERGTVSRLSDVFALDAVALGELDRMGEKSAENLVASLAAARDTTLARFLIGLGIRHVGTNVAGLLAQRFGDLDRLASASVDTLAAIAGVGPVIAESVSRFFGDPRNRAETERFRELGVRWEVRAEAAPIEDGPLSGKSFVLTGTLQNLKRSEARERIEAAGGRVTGSVSKKTDYLVAGADPGSKLRKAGELEVAVLDEAGLLEILK